MNLRPLQMVPLAAMNLKVGEEIPKENTNTSTLCVCNVSISSVQGHRLPHQKCPYFDNLKKIIILDININPFYLESRCNKELHHC